MLKYWEAFYKIHSILKIKLFYKNIIEYQKILLNTQIIVYPKKYMQKN